MLDTDSIHTVAFQHPQENLAKHGKHRRNPEAEFTAFFAQAYRAQLSKVHAGTNRANALFVREVPVPGNGIADLVVINWKQSQTLPQNHTEVLASGIPTLRAFEVKLKDWRGGLMQAHRYKYFSNASILVIPAKKLELAEAKLDLFQKLGVGLWGFDSISGVITKVFTPRPKQQHLPKQNEKALRIALEAALS